MLEGNSQHSSPEINQKRKRPKPKKTISAKTKTTPVKQTSARKVSSSKDSKKVLKKSSTKKTKSSSPDVNAKESGLPIEPREGYQDLGSHPGDVGFASFDEGNLGPLERFISIGSGALLMTYGLSRRSFKGILLAMAGGGLLYRGITGHSYVYQWLGMNHLSMNTEEEGTILEDSITIARSPHQVYQFVHEPENLLHLWGNPIHIQSLAESKIRWTIAGPEGLPLELDAEMVADVTNRLVAWRSLPNAAISHEGSIYLHEAEEEATELKVMLKYDPPVSKLIEKLFGEDPQQKLHEKLLLLKQRIETSSIDV